MYIKTEFGVDKELNKDIESMLYHRQRSVLILLMRLKIIRKTIKEIFIQLGNYNRIIFVLDEGSCI